MESDNIAVPQAKNVNCSYFSYYPVCKFNFGWNVKNMHVSNVLLGNFYCYQVFAEKIKK